MLSASRAARPTVSVGLPVYNGASYVGEAIMAVLAQDDIDFELIISDNGSTDDTERICRDLTRDDPRAQYVRTEVNQGAAWNFNRTVELARGRYFKWAAHDDRIEPTFLRRCVDLLEQHPDVSLAYTRATMIDDHGDPVSAYPPLRYCTAERAAERGRDVLMNPSACYECFGVMRLDQLRTTGLIGAFSSSDRVLLFEMALRGRFMEVPEVLFLHRQHTARSVHSFSGARAREAWFDPARGATVTLPRWRLVREHLAGLRRAPITAGARGRLLLTLAAWIRTMLRPLSRDVLAWVWHGGIAPIARRVNPQRAA